MHASVRVYRKISDFPELVRKVEAGFVPILAGTPGFRDYWIIRTGDDVGVSIGLFDSEEEARNSHQQAAAWVKENMGGIIREAPETIDGSVVYHRNG